MPILFMFPFTYNLAMVYKSVSLFQYLKLYLENSNSGVLCQITKPDTIILKKKLNVLNKIKVP